MEEKIRIYIGGLGLNVKEDDLMKTFTSPQLGTVDSVEILRTKGRSFAYLDFVPVSEKGLAKLFSTYNGCMWKGGKLRLEKAKEHYLVRLKREWDEEVETAANLHSQNVDATANVHSTEKPRKDPNMEKLQLQIFFPKLRKIKPVPFKGTGKHKYSFQRVEVPPLPVHFCDCEEHSAPAETMKEAKASNCDDSENVGVNEEELNIMESVLNKILKRENCSNATSTKTEFTVQVNSSASLLDNVQVDDHEDDQVNDEDNLIMNMVTRPNDKVVYFKDQRHESANVDWDSTLKKPKNFTDRCTQETHGSQKRDTVASKKRKTPYHEDDRNNVSARKRMKGSRDMVVNDSNTVLSMQPELEPGSANLNHDDASPSKKTDDIPKLEEQQSLTIPSFANKENKPSQVKEIEKTSDVLPDEPRETVDKSARGAAWLQKSSWTQLVGDTSSSSFSISQVLPGVSFEKQELPQVTNFVFSGNNKQHKSFGKERSYNAEKVNKTKKEANKDFATDSSKVHGDASTRKDEDRKVLSCEQSGSVEKNLKDGEASTSRTGLDGPSELKRPSFGDIVTSEVCPFMRSAASLKEWTKSKAALSGSLKKKGKKKQEINA